MTSVGLRQVDITELISEHNPELREKLLLDIFPSLQSLDWLTILSNDMDLLGGIIREKVISERTPGKVGRRKPGLTRAEAEPVIDKIFGKDSLARPYTFLQFKDALRALCEGIPMERLEKKIGLPSSWLIMLMNGQSIPTKEHIEKISVAFEKSPGYFMEYRTIKVTEAVFFYLESHPEESIKYYEGSVKVKRGK